MRCLKRKPRLTVFDGGHFRIGGESRRPCHPKRKPGDNTLPIVTSENENPVEPPFRLLIARNSSCAMAQLDDPFPKLVEVEFNIARIPLQLVATEPPAACVGMRVESWVLVSPDGLK